MLFCVMCRSVDFPGMWMIYFDFANRSPDFWYSRCVSPPVIPR